MSAGASWSASRVCVAAGRSLPRRPSTAHPRFHADGQVGGCQVVATLPSSKLLESKAQLRDGTK